MNPFQKFARLTPATQRRIIKSARTVERLTRGQVRFDDTVEAMTDHEWNVHLSRREHREAGIRFRHQA